ncbi:MAG TPA: 50S ribosomal protein L3 [bacterium]|nr:50S ribosomal protein L3 [bacterium]
MKFILGKKLEMSHLYNEAGQMVPVTVVKAGPCVVTQVKNAEKDTYNAVQLAFIEKRKVNRPVAGHLKKAGEKVYRYLREFSLKNENGEAFTVGSEIKSDIFEAGEKVKVTGTSKGKGFQGVVKRHKFAGGRATHGNKDQERHSGSVGAKGVAHVFKGTRMGGHMGDEKVTVSNLSVVKVDAENNLLYIKGSIPGAKNSLVKIIAA